MINIEPPGTPLPPHPAPSKPTLTRFLNRARTAVGISGEVDVLLTSDTELKRLNRTFRGKNKPTDVLSFPADPIPGLPQDFTQHAGDLAISLDTAARQATRYGHTLDLELRTLLLHGLLHLAGYDHETDSGEMATLEADLRTTLKLPTGLIDRTLAPNQSPTSSSQRNPRSPQVSSQPNPPSPRLSSRPKRSAVERPASPAPDPISTRNPKATPQSKRGPR